MLSAIYSWNCFRTEAPSRFLRKIMTGNEKYATPHLCMHARRHSLDFRTGALELMERKSSVSPSLIKCGLDTGESQSSSNQTTFGGTCRLLQDQSLIFLHQKHAQSHFAHSIHRQQHSQILLTAPCR